jgi:hypothetical protein
MRKIALMTCALLIWMAAGCADESNSEWLAVVVPRDGSVLLRVDLGSEGVNERLGWITPLGSFTALADTPDGKPVTSMGVKTDTGRTSIRLYWTERDAGRCGSVLADWIYTDDQVIRHRIQVCLAGDD